MSVAVRHFLAKSEPDEFSIDELARRGTAPWDGVRNYVARNHLRAMSTGDLILFYHSSCTPPGVVGVARVCRTAYPDPSQFDPKSPYHDPASPPDRPRWSAVDVEFVAKLPRQVTLAELKADPELEGMLVRRPSQRLSVQPVEAGHFERVLALARHASPP